MKALLAIVALCAIPIALQAQCGPPTISCPTNVSQAAEATKCVAIINYPLPTFTAPCGLPPDSILGFTTLGSFQGKTYYISNSGMTAPAAYADAQGHGGFVVTINNAAENEFVRKAMSQEATTAWIGYSDAATEGTFVWQDGDTSTYNNWNLGEPNNQNGEDYTQMYNNGTWNDLDTLQIYRYILELSGGFEQTSGQASGSVFGIGTITNTFEVTDIMGNSASCSFTVTLMDTTAPVIVCPANVTAIADSNSCTAYVPLRLDSVFEQCSYISTQSPISTYVFDGSGGTQDIVLQIPLPQLPASAGTLTILHRGDINNSGSEQFEIRAEDNSLLGLTTNGNQCDNFYTHTTIHVTTSQLLAWATNDTVTITLAQGTAVNATLCSSSDAFASLSYSTANITNSFTSGGADASGSYPLGNTQVVFTATDQSGNIDSCTVTVTVKDTTAPVITCPSDIIVSNDAGVCGAKVCYTMPYSSDLCEPSVPAGLNLVKQMGNIRYYKSNAFISYSAAKSLANSIGGNLAKITSDALNDTLFNATGGLVWIAGTDEETEGVWKYDNCEPLTYQNFHAGEPNDFGSGEDYLELSTTGDWYDYGPSASRFALIEVEGAGVVQIAGLPRGSVFPIGITTNTFVTTDASGNSDTCSFTVTVNDTTSPTFFTDSICLGDSLYVGGGWQTVPGVYIDTATTASGCDSLLITTLYYRSNSICNPDTTERMLYIVSDSAWTLSNVVSTATSNSYPWPGAANMLPHDSTFVLAAEVGQPYPWNHLYTVMGSQVIKAYSGVMYYRYEFELTNHQALNARFRMFVDDNMQIFVNRHEIALEEDMGKENWRTANHDILFNDNGTIDNGYLGGDTFDTYTAVSPDNIFVTGNNDIILAIRNRTSKPDKGGFSFRMDLDKAGQAVIVKKDASFEAGLSINPSFELYPNPVVDQLSLVMKTAISDVDYTVTITDISGRVLSVISQSGSELQETSTINVSSYAPGVYFVKVNSGTQSVVKRFVKR